MCGIIGFAGKTEAVEVLIDGLERLEYRGYDSAGVAVVSPDGRLQVKKSKGRLSVLRTLLEAEEPMSGGIGIGHTRWATHGEPNDVNAHPHVGQEGSRKYACLSLFLSFVLLLSFAFSSCAPQTEAGKETVTFTDALDRTVSVPKHPARVAALLGSFADVWQLSGGTLVAAPGDAFEDYGLDPAGVADLGGAHSPSLETLLSVSPDLVLASASTASHVALSDTLDALGIPVLYFDVDHFSDYLSMLSFCTSLTGREDLYAQNGTSVAFGIEQLTDAYRTADIPAHERRVLLLRVSSGAVKAKGSEGTVLGEMLASLGCVNIADLDGALTDQLSVEAVIRESPYHVFAVTMGTDTATARAALERMIAEDPAWRTLAAVREGRLHVMDGDLFHRKPNAKWGEAYEILYETLTK